MKLVLFFVVVLGGAAAILFQTAGGAREAMRYAWAQPGKERDSIDAYKEGRDLFLGSWSGKATEVSSWGDDAYVSARQINGDMWAASGRVSFVVLGTPVQHPWLCFFDRRKHEVLVYEVAGDSAEDINLVMHGDPTSALARLRKADEDRHAYDDTPVSSMRRVGR